MRVLVTGGAGYIGSFMVKHLLETGSEVTIIDSLERGNFTGFGKVTLKIGSLLDKSFLADVFSGGKFDGVIHFAGYISVKESTEALGAYFENNVQATVNLLEEMVKSGTTSLIFSSSAAVYGNPVQVPIPEDHPKNPESPYGESKLMVEKILHWYNKDKGINSVSLRYFNASGAALDGSMGESHNPETHIIPSAILALMHDKSFTLYGTDYDTKDGTCVRDYIHVLDLVKAHASALQKLQNTKGAFSYNVGSGVGYTNKEVLDTVREVSGKTLKVEEAPRRSGDPKELIADPTRIQAELNFTPEYSDLKTIVSSAWKWHSKGNL